MEPLFTEKEAQVGRSKSATVLGQLSTACLLELGKEPRLSVDTNAFQF